MTRILLAIVGTLVGLVALLSFKTHSIPAGAPHGLPSAALPGSSTSAPVAGSSTSTSAPPDPSSTTPTTPSHSAAAASRTIAGQAIQTNYGVVQVQVVVTGTKIQNVSFLQLTADDPRSQSINDQAGPILLQETLSAQNANINTVSGATYTSEGYLQSLQSALDQAGIK
ncbi:MAG TPA: FMN-binding protein [Jatrophihabitans sp.]|jgi:uncharacterized protein with FMN-binding domain